MSKLKVLIVGATIGGPMAVYWLAKAGARWTGCEIRTSGVAVKRKLPGMEEAVRANNTTLARYSLVACDGRLYGTIKPTKDPNQQSAVSEFETFRDHLGEILYNMTKNNGNI